MRSSGAGKLLQTPDVASWNHAKSSSPYLKKASRRVGTDEELGGALLCGAGGETRTAWSGDFMFSFRGLSYVDQSPWDWVVWSDEAPAPPLHPLENGSKAACTAMWLGCSRKTSLKVTGTSLPTWSCLQSLGNHLYFVKLFVWDVTSNEHLRPRLSPGKSCDAAKSVFFVFLSHRGQMMGYRLGCGQQRHLWTCERPMINVICSCVIRIERLKVKILQFITQSKDSVVNTVYFPQLGVKGCVIQMRDQLRCLKPCWGLLSHLRHRPSDISAGPFRLDEVLRAMVEARLPLRDSQSFMSTEKTPWNQMNAYIFRLH